MEQQRKEEVVICLKCHGTGIVKESDGSVHTCFECLRKGNMDQHGKNMKDSGIKL